MGESSASARYIAEKLGQPKGAVLKCLCEELELPKLIFCSLTHELNEKRTLHVNKVNSHLQLLESGKPKWLDIMIRDESSYCLIIA
jgi:hypothetical protein